MRQNPSVAVFGYQPNNGSLTVSAPTANDVVEIFFVPTAEALRLAGKSEDTSPVLLARTNIQTGQLAVFPLRTVGDGFLQPKYSQIRAITMVMPAPLSIDDDAGDWLSLQPRGLLRDFQFGLGFPKEYRVIVDTIEAKSACTRIDISPTAATAVQGDALTISATDFENIRAELDRITSRANAASSRVKSASVTNSLATALGIDHVAVRRGTHPVTQLLADAAADADLDLSDEEQSMVLETVVTESAHLAREQPDRLAKLRNDIELVSLEVLIERFETALSARKGESFWQSFFAENPFALHLAFGLPVLRVQEQASVGGKKLDGSGEKITDFLVKSAMTGNIGLFEIKKPGTRLLSASTYRAGIYGPSTELAGSINQALDQKYQLERSLLVLKDTTHEYDLQSYAVRCCLIIGTSPVDADEVKSFELLRNDSRSVDVVTFDELLEKLRQLRILLAGAAVTTDPDADPPVGED